ncbi:MAG: TatD family hydrolase [Deltaproteobacteria bacterium]|nr:TatD family hydrolase [Deltaproteobacteria bacterium]
MWFDSHCHVTAARFDADREDVLSRAREAGVDTLVAIGSGYGIAGNAAAVALAEREPRVFAAVGVHPHEAVELDDENRRAIRGWLAHPKVMALGECGLDYHYMNSPRDTQLAVFAEQVSLARELDIPVVIHVRGDDNDSNNNDSNNNDNNNDNNSYDAYEDLLAIWIERGEGALSGVLHCYTGTLPFAQRALEHGFYVSFSGIVTFKRSDALRDVAAGLPLERLMVETDAPFLAPEGHRGRRNEPAWVPRIGETLATLHQTTREEIARVTSENARRFFRLAQEA